MSTIQTDEDVIDDSVHPRMGWDEQFKVMAEKSDDVLLDDDCSLSDWDDEQWEWE